MDYICQNSTFFKNPNKLPLNEVVLEYKTFKRTKKPPKDLLDKLNNDEKQNLDKNLKNYYDIRTEKVSALDACFIQDKFTFCEYQPYYTEISKEENDQFLMKNKLFLNCLKYILQRSYQQFWCLIVFEPKIRKILNSFVENPLLRHELKLLGKENEQSEVELDLYVEICDKVAKIYSRMLIPYESETEYMALDTAVNYLEQNQLITCPKILHLCTIYNNINRKLVDLIIDVFFSSRRKTHYTKELKKTFDHALSVFDILGGQICGFEEKVKVIPDYISKRPVNFDPYWMEEATVYLLDMATNLNAFLSVCKPAVNFASELGIPFRLAYFYNRVYHELYTIMKRTYKNIPYDWRLLEKRIYEQLALGRSEFVAVYHIFVEECIDKVVQLTDNPQKQEEHVEQYLKLITSALEDEFFIFDYQNSNQIDQQFQMLSDFYPQLDHTRTNYILECLSTLPTLQDLKNSKIVESELSFNNRTPRQDDKQEQNELKSCQELTKNNRESLENTNSNKVYVNSDEIQLLIQSVLETLPHLGDGFIRKCLESYNYDPVEVIAAILDENLPPHLLDIPPDTIQVPPEPEPEQPVLAYRGKKPGYKDARELLNDKSDIQSTKDFILKKSIVSFDLYDDEYDDRDDIETGHFYEKARDDEPDMYKYMENRFEGYELVSDPSESSSDEEIEEPYKSGKTSEKASGNNYYKSGGGKSGYDRMSQSNEASGRQYDKSGRKSNFCEDPALIRERREAQRRGNFQGGKRGGKGDVVGKPKGQGQDTNVLQNRDKKNTNKSTRANHNRKGGAQWKRNKGMFPS